MNHAGFLCKIFALLLQTDPVRTQETSSLKVKADLLTAYWHGEGCFMGTLAVQQRK